MKSETLRTVLPLWMLRTKLHRLPTMEFPHAHQLKQNHHKDQFSPVNQLQSELSLPKTNYTFLCHTKQKQEVTQQESIERHTGDLA